MDSAIKHAAAPVVSQTNFGVNAKVITLSGNDPHAADISGRDGNACTESAGSKPVRIYIHKDCGWSCTTRVVLICHHHLSGWTNSDIAEVFSPWAGRDLRCFECPHHP